ncbi:lipoate--protein ligase family protein, partial [bacterium]
MASDQALLEVQAEKPLPTLRFLSFSPPCVLVGYFQAI